MYTIWVKSGSTPRPRRTHRLRPGAEKTECGLFAFYMNPVSTSNVKSGIVPPQFCHVCFKYRYRFLSRPTRDWSHQRMYPPERHILIHPRATHSYCLQHGIFFNEEICPICQALLARAVLAELDGM